MKLSICVPCFNEEKTINLVLKKVLKANICGLSREIIVVDDGSVDKTREVILKIAKENKNIKTIFKKMNEGKGAAVRDAFKKSTGDIVLIQDADMEYDPDEYPILLEPIITRKADVVYGSRFMGGWPHRVVYYWHSVMNSFLTKFSNMLTNINLTDMETCYKVIKGDIARNLVKNIKSNRFGIEPELTAKLAKIPQIRFYEVGISYYGRTYEEGKHINWKDGLRAIWEIIRFNLLN